MAMDCVSPNPLVGAVVVRESLPEAATLPTEIDGLLAEEGTRVTRALLAAGGAFDVDAARAFVALVDDPPAGESDALARAWRS